MTKSNTQTPWGEIGYLVYKRTYARRLNEDDKNSVTEEFPQTVERELKGIEEQLNLKLLPHEKDFYRKMRLQLKGSVAGRFMWQLGTKTVDKLGLPSLQNCAFTVVNEPVRPFTWAMDLLMLGSGVGYNIQKKHVYSIPKLKGKVEIKRQDDKSADFIVPDTREGWVKLLGKTLKAHFYSGKSFSYSTMLIRSKGAPIKGFGGLSSGPEILCEGIERINEILNKRANQKMRPIDALDIMNIIGSIVVAGNVRRSAQISIGDYDDLEYLKAKRWDLGSIPNWRAMSNNSVVVDDVKKLTKEFWETYEQGEPYGLINIALSKKVGRLGETKYPDPKVEGYNPCQPGFATVLTPEGIKTFDEVTIGDEIWSKEGWTKIINKWSTGIKKVYEYRTTGGVFIGTENHRVETKSGKTEVDNAKQIKTIAGKYLNRHFYDDKFNAQAVMDGLFFGDGYHKKMKGRSYTYPVLIVGEKDYDYFTSEVQHFIKNQFSERGSCAEYNCETTILEKEKDKAHKLKFPKKYFLNNFFDTVSFLRGLYSADGSVIKQKGNGVRVTYKTASKQLAHEVQLILNVLGIRSYITRNKSKKNLFNNGVYQCKESYDINITKDVDIFYEKIGFIQEYKNERIREALKKWVKTESHSFTKIVEKNYLGEYEVFDITVNNNSHTYWTGGLSVSNCAEQSLNNNETCCLAEVYLPNIESKEELWDVVKMLYRVNKHSLALKCHLKETEKVVHENMRMGIGMTGILMATDEQVSWLDTTYKKLRAYDEEYSLAMGWPKSIKLTTVKPSGTLSLLAGVTPGIHPSPAGPYYIRRVRLASNSPLVDLCKKHGYNIEYQRNFDKSEDHSTYVVEFPCKVPENTPIGDQIDVLDQLEMVKKIQTIWSDNSVSVTAYYKKEDLPKLKQYLEDNFKHNFKSLSFLLYQGHGFDQAPYETISKKQYDEMIAKVTPITSAHSFFENEIEEFAACENGACPVK